MKIIAFALMILSVVSTQASIEIDSVAADYVRPVLQSAGGAARINYVGVCAEQKELRFPKIDAEPASPGTTGIAAVRQIFRNDPQITVEQDRSGLLRITMGSFSTSALRTKFPTLTFFSGAQYTPRSAVDVIAIALKTYAVEHGLHLDLALSLFDHLVSGPAEGAPHLPPKMQNVDAGDALDSVAQTFKGIVLFGTCTQPDGTELFKIDYMSGS